MTEHYSVNGILELIFNCDNSLLAVGMNVYVSNTCGNCNLQMKKKIVKCMFFILVSSSSVSQWFAAYNN